MSEEEKGKLRHHRNHMENRRIDGGSGMEI